MAIKDIYPSKGDNQGLVHLYKIRLIPLSGAVHFIAKNHIKHSRYKSLYPWKEIFEYTQKVTGRMIVCGLIFLKFMITVMKLIFVADHRSKEKELKEKTLWKVRPWRPPVIDLDARE